ncbi:hypothetical protein ETB97_007944 [Aspergillus alliaceus]|uniref:Uncharacterized protein n=1 Tax=Petromyces alliaceus TaxID=209559 RepID=A0A8H6A9Q5_PETAA|nr:hypothetical protein ETB97_007944 [Aspergillus burnettii]
MESFLKILFSLLVDDGKLLSRETTAEMFKPQLSHPSKHCLNEAWRHPDYAKYAVRETEGNTPLERKTDLFWFIDRVSRLCGDFGVQVLPPGGEEIGKMIQIFERTFPQTDTYMGCMSGGASSSRLLDMLSEDGITFYPMDWDRWLPVHERRKLFSGVESTYTGDGEPSELAGVQEERHPPPVCDPEKDNI